VTRRIAGQNRDSLGASCPPPAFQIRLGGGLIDAACHGCGHTLPELADLTACRRKAREIVAAACAGKAPGAAYGGPGGAPPPRGGAEDGTELSRLTERAAALAPAFTGHGGAGR